MERTNQYDDQNKFARRVGTQTLKSLMGGEVPFVGARDPRFVKKQMEDDAWKANRISDVVPRHPEPSADSEGKE